jgi:hypothetical protein
MIAFIYLIRIKPVLLLQDPRPGDLRRMRRHAENRYNVASLVRLEMGQASGPESYFSETPG